MQASVTPSRSSFEMPMKAMAPLAPTFTCALPAAIMALIFLTTSATSATRCFSVWPRLLIDSQGILFLRGGHVRHIMELRDNHPTSTQGAVNVCCLVYEGGSNRHRLL